MEKFEDLDPNQIKEGLLLNEVQINYLFSCLKENLHLLKFIKSTLQKEGRLDNGHFFIEKLEGDLKYCVTILRKENDL